MKADPQLLLERAHALAQAMRFAGGQGSSDQTKHHTARSVSLTVGDLEIKVSFTKLL
jgi:hypothetical protein